MKKIKLAILASGSGTNAENIIQYFKSKSNIDVTLIASNKSSAYVLKRAEKLQVDSFAFTNNQLEDGSLGKRLKEKNIDYVILAGFLLKIPQNLLNAFEDKIINIHPALLPKFGGKGMYGGYVHKAVLDAKEDASGITIHLVNENYDEGNILFQAMTEVDQKDTADTLASKIHELEYRYFPQIIEDYVLNTR